MPDPLRSAASMAKYNRQQFGLASRVTPNPIYPKKGDKEPFLPSKKALEHSATRSHYRRIVEWQKERGRDPLGDIIPINKLIGVGGCSALWHHPSYTRILLPKEKT